MSDDFDARIDRDLRRAGQRWRSQRQSPRAHLDPAVFSSAPARHGVWRLLPAMAGVLALFAVGMLVVLSLPKADDRIAAASPTPASSPSPTPATPSGAPSDEPTEAPTPVETARTGPSDAPTSPSSSLRPPETVVVEGTSWTRHFGVLPEVQRVESVTVDDGRFIATGYRCVEEVDPRCNRDRSREYIELESRDGLAWSVSARITMPPGVEDGEFIRDDEFGYIFRAGWGYYAGGAGLWTSRDGFTWEWIGGDDGLRPAGCPPRTSSSTLVLDLYRGDDAYFAWGDTLCGTQMGFSAWRSTDGLEWRQIDEEDREGPVVERSGVFVKTTATHIAASRDGIDWTDVYGLGEPMTPHVVGSGFIAVEGAGSTDAGSTVLISDDGFEWHDIGIAVAPDSAAPYTTDGNRAFGLERSYLPEDMGAAWISSADGSQWTRYELPMAIEDRMDSGALLGSRVVIVDSEFYSAFPTVLVADIP